MDYVLIVLAILLAIVSIVGAIVPGIAGPPFGFFAVLALSFVKNIHYSTGFLVAIGLIAAFITALDYLVPIWGTKAFGGTQKGVRGSTIGLIIGLLATFFIPVVGILGILLGPFIGAYIGEKSAGTPDNKAWRSAIGSFLGFLAGTFVKVVFGIIMTIIVVKDVIISFIK